MKLLCWLVLSAQALLAFLAWRAAASACAGSDVCNQDASTFFGAACLLLLPISIAAAFALVVIWAREHNWNA